MKAAGIFVTTLSQDGFERHNQETKFQTIIFSSQFGKVTIQKSIVELWTVILNQMIKFHLSDKWFHQISDHKHDICLYGKLSTKLLAKAADKNT